MEVIKPSFEMSVESASIQNDSITVITTGAKYIIHTSGERGVISCWQRINKERLLGQIEFTHSLKGTTIEKNTSQSCMLQYFSGIGCYWLKMQINADGVLEMHASARETDMKLSITGDFLPELCENKDGNYLFADDFGGIGFFPQRGYSGRVSHSFTDRLKWKINYRMNATHPRLFVSVFPPRKFNNDLFAETKNKGIVMYGYSSAILKDIEFYDLPYPSDDEITKASTLGSVFVLFLQFNKGRLTGKNADNTKIRETQPDASYSSPFFLPINEKELSRVIKKAHSAGMSVLPYLSPYHSMAQGTDFLDLAQNTLSTYGFDGVYFDGLSPDVLDAYNMIRGLRNILGSKTLFLHTSIDPFESDIITAPFIHAYADFVLRGEFKSAPDDVSL